MIFSYLQKKNCFEDNLVLIWDSLNDAEGKKWSLNYTAVASRPLKLPLCNFTAVCSAWFSWAIPSISILKNTF